MSFDPFGLSDRLRENFIRYLLEAHRIHDREPVLRQQFEEELRTADRFVRDPLVSAIPTYLCDRPAAELLGRDAPPRLHPGLRDIKTFDFTRPLYRHQVRAIERIGAGRDTVVATGTGSGKTECFLFPILDAALRAREQNHPGVMAILVYPLNALANDQLDRMRELIGASTKVTFGRYTSQTPRNLTSMNERERADAERYPNERVSREQIRDDPPQILLTNFAMLEYLLLRPRDQGIFREPSLRYVVLDEAHAYTGSQGIDIGLLMRRLCQRYPKRPQFVLTSATLGEPGDEGKIAEFASALSGAKFTKDDVITGDVADPFDRKRLLAATAVATAALADEANPQTVQHAAGDAAEMRAWLRRCGLEPGGGSSAGEILHGTLRQLAPAAKLYDALLGQAKTIADLADQVIGDRSAQSQRVVRALLAAMTFARPAGKHVSPLMSVRLHHFFRGLAGASVLLEPLAANQKGASAHVVKLTLEDLRQDEETGRKMLPLRTCVHCGLPVVSIRSSDGGARWDSAPLGKRSHVGGVELLTWFDPLTFEADDEDEEADDATKPKVKSPLFGVLNVELCIACGAMGDGREPACNCDGESRVRLYPIIKGADDSGNLSTCPCCGGLARPAVSVLRDFQTGEDAPTALLAEEIVRALPIEPARSELPAGGRQLLAFSDSRQRAAFFMPYLTRTTAEPSYLYPLLRAADELQRIETQSPDVLSVLSAAVKYALEQPWIVVRQTDENDGFERYEIRPATQLTVYERKQVRRELALSLYAQLVSPHTHRTKFGGMMLAAGDVELSEAQYTAAKAAAPTLFADEQIGRDALQRMLMSVVRRFAVKFEPVDISPRHFMDRGPAMVTLHRNPVPSRVPGTQRERKRWNPYEAPSRSRAQSVKLSATAQVVRQVLGPRATDTEISGVLDGLWGFLIDAQHGVLESTSHAGEYQLPVARLRVSVRGRWHRCTKCNASTIHPMDGTCEIRGCGGKLISVSEDDRRERLEKSHRARRYLRESLPLVVKEHTAQLTLQSGREYQEQFKAGRVNVLSSSTTFEMGVDVGQLHAVLLRNVPPTAANYIQRAGRAGRRQQGVAHAVTYARTTPHDQHHYFQPQDVVVGRVPVPIIHTANRVLAQRHVNSLLLGRFLAEEFAAHEEQNLLVSDLFPALDAPEPKPVARYVEWCQRNNKLLAKTVTNMLPDDCELDAAAAVNASADTLYTTEPHRADTVYHRGLRVPLRSYQLQEQELKELIQQAMANNQFDRVKGLGGAVMRVQTLALQIMEQHLIDFLSSEHWLPGYAFPQDVVKLTVRQERVSGAMRLERDREIGISEYSPGSEIIADGKLFESVGVNLERRQPELKYFRSDPRTRRVAIDLTEDQVIAATPGVDHPPLRFLEPVGFTTQWDAPVAEPNLYRLRPPSSSDVFLRDGTEQFMAHPQLAGVESGIKQDATLFRANVNRDGNGFRICLNCGRGLEIAEIRKGVHTRPYGGDCRGKPVPLALAHTFKTDVLQVRFPGFHRTPDLGNKPFWLTLSTAFVIAACRELHIDPADLDGTYRSTTEHGRDGELVLYDRVPGGAGYVRRIETDLKRVFTRAHQLLSRCDNTRCDVNSSCYACLRSQKNQFDWEFLDRSAPLAWIAGMLRGA